MFVSCPHCNFLVALGTDDQPPARCPRCARPLRDDAPSADASAAAPDPPVDPAPTPVREASVVGTQGESSPSSTPPSDYIPWRVAPKPATQAHAAEAEPVIEAAAAGNAPDDVDADAIAEGVQRSALETGLSNPALDEPEAVPAPPDEANADGDDDVPATEAREPIAESVAQAETPTQASDETSADTAVMAHAEPEPGASPRAIAARDGDDGTAVVPAAEDDTAASAAISGDAQPPPSDATARPARARRRAHDAPSFVRRPAARMPVDRRRQWLKATAIAVLSLLLALQLLLSDRTALAADARWRPLLSTLCGALGCALPPWREPRALQVLERDVRAHPSIPGVLRVTARMRNDARWAQPWPLLRLTLSDVHGRDVAARRFQPREYLGGAPTQAGLASGQTAALSMDIVEPGPQAVAFTFDFE